jgi:hypothetical protein
MRYRIYTKKIKEANTESIEMSLEDLFQFALDIEESAINLVRMMRENRQITMNKKPTTRFLGSRG